MKNKSYFRTRLMHVLVLLCMLLCATRSNATTYYFSISGADTNSGLSAAAPKKSITAALALMTGGNVIKFRRGDEWYLPFSSFDLRNKSSFTIDAYDSASFPQPVIAGMIIVPNSSWVYDGSNRWRAVLPLTCTDIFRVFANGNSKLNLEFKQGSTNTKTSLTSTLDYFFDSAANTVYLNTGSATVAPQYVEVIPANNSMQSGISTLLIENTHDISIQNIDFRGGGKWNIAAIYAPSRNITISNCTFERASAFASGVLIGDTLVATDYVANLTFTGNVVDKSFISEENNTTQFLSGDGIFCLNALDTALIKDNTVLNWGHVGISLTAYYANAPYIHGVHHVTMEHNDITAGASGYMHAIDVSGLPGLTTYNVIKRNNCHDYTTTSHLQGSNNLFFSNIFTGVVETSHLTQSKQPYAADIAPWRRDSGLMESRDNWILNNTFANTGGASFWVTWNDSAMPLNSNITNIVIANNIMFNPGPKPIAGYNLGLNIDSMAYGTMYYRNNNLFGTDSLAKVVRFKKYPYGTAAEFNTTLGCGTYCSNNTQSTPAYTNQSNPLLSTYFALGNNVLTALKTGGIDYTSYIDNYIPLSEFTDFFDNTWRYSNPSRGAVQK